MSSETNQPATGQGEDGAEQPSPKQPTATSSTPLSRGKLLDFITNCTFK